MGHILSYLPSGAIIPKTKIKLNSLYFLVACGKSAWRIYVRKAMLIVMTKTSGKHGSQDQFDRMLGRCPTVKLFFLFAAAAYWRNIAGQADRWPVMIMWPYMLDWPLFSPYNIELFICLVTIHVAFNMHHLAQFRLQPGLKPFFLFKLTCTDKLLLRKRPCILKKISWCLC